MNVSEVTTRFNAGNPCPVCGSGSKGCSATGDGLHFCRGEHYDTAEWRQMTNDGTFASYRKIERTHAHHYKPPPKGNSAPPKDWASETERFAAAFTDTLRKGLAELLRLPLVALAVLRIGWDGTAWTFPESNGTGRIVGIARRFRDGSKKMQAGGNRGLTLPAGWKNRAGTLFVVEGPTDTLAMTLAGLCCVGRPSNSGGVEHLSALLAGWLKERGIIVVGENDAKPDGSWPGKDGAVKVASALSAKLGRVVPIAFPPADAKDVRQWLTAPERAEDTWPERGATLRKHLEANAEPARPSGSPPPMPDYRPFPVHALPPVLREFVAEAAASVGCDPAFAALPALTVAGAAVGAALVVCPKRKYEQPPLLWLFTVGDSGTGKSPAFKPSADRAFCIDHRLKEEFVAALRKYRADLEGWESTENPNPDTEPAKPVRERFAVIDATIERLTVESTTSPRGLVVVRDEADGWLSSFARYKGKGGGSDVPNWLSMYEAGPVRYMRRTGEPREVEAERAFVAVCGGIQPDILKASLSDPTFISSGLAARIGFAMPPKACPKWSDRELSDDTERALADTLDFLRKLPFDPKNGPGRVSLDAVALARFKKLNDEFAAAAENLDGGPMAAVLPKAVRFALRLALVWWCVSEAAAGRDPGRGSVSDEAMSAGEELARWFVREAERVYAMLAERPEDRSARTLAEWVKRKGGRVRARDLMRSNGTKYPTTAAAELALDALVSAGWGQWQDDPPKAGGGRPGRVFVLQTLPDTRHNPTELPAGYGPPPDTTPDPPPDERGFPDRNGVVSDSVGCRVNATPAPPANADGDVVSGSTPEAGPPPVWDDSDQFFDLMTSRGWKWPGVLAWLKATPTTGFFDLTAEQRRRVADHLRQLAPPTPKQRKK